MGLTTFIKKNENNKEVNYVRISDEQLKEYVIKDINNSNNDDNKHYYEEILTDNNVNKQEKPYSTGDLIQGLTTINNDYNDKLLTVINDYNNRLQLVNEELIKEKSKQLLLEDKASREGLYLNEIRDLKTEVNRRETLIKVLITLITILLIGLTGFISYSIALNNNDNNKKIKSASEIVQTEHQTQTLTRKK
jgi:hypothetical protein